MSSQDYHPLSPSNSCHSLIAKNNSSDKTSTLDPIDPSLITTSKDTASTYDCVQNGSDSMERRIMDKEGSEQNVDKIGLEKEVKVEQMEVSPEKHKQVDEKENGCVDEISDECPAPYEETCAIPYMDEEDDAIKDLVDYIVELVSTAVPKAMPTASARSTHSPSIEVIDLSGEGTRLEDILSTNVSTCVVCLQQLMPQFEIRYNNRVYSICSNKCVELAKKSVFCGLKSCGKIIPVSSGHASGQASSAYRPNFNTKSALCSLSCFQEFNKFPNSNSCHTCLSDMMIEKMEDNQSNDKGLYWQTYEFCGNDCLLATQLSSGDKCSHCHQPVNKQSLGKYSVRFGEVIKQFCAGQCLESFKKGLKVCAFCQKDLKSCKNITIKTFGFGERMRVREFCDPICTSNYETVLNSKNSLDVECTQCNKKIDSKFLLMKFNLDRRPISICSQKCLAIFKFKRNLNSVFCENCFSVIDQGDMRTPNQMLHYSGNTKTFCTRKCMSMFVLKNRKIVPCLCCKVKKYNFDLIEKYNWQSEVSQLFCSLYCLELYDVAQECKAQLNANIICVCDWCRKKDKPQFFHVIGRDEKDYMKFVIHNYFCSYQCISQYHRNRIAAWLKPIMPVIKRKRITNKTTTLFSSGDSSSSGLTWTPSFKSQQQGQTQKSVNAGPITYSRNTGAFSVSTQIQTPNPTTRLVTLTSTQSHSVNSNIITLTPNPSNNPSYQLRETSTSSSNHHLMPGASASTVLASMASASSSTNSVLVPTTSSTSSSQHQQVIREITKEVREVIIKVPQAKLVKNKGTFIRPANCTKKIQVSPIQFDGESQTEKEPTIVCPIMMPLPIFMPTPIPYMQPLAFPLPLPIPIFFPSAHLAEAEQKARIEALDKEIQEKEKKLEELEKKMTKMSVSSNDNLLAGLENLPDELLDLNSCSQSYSTPKRDQPESSTSSERRRKLSGSTNGSSSRGRGSRGGRARGGSRSGGKGIGRGGRGSKGGKRKEEWETDSEEEEEEDQYPSTREEEEEEEEEEETQDGETSMDGSQSMQSDSNSGIEPPKRGGRGRGRGSRGGGRGRGRRINTANTPQEASSSSGNALEPPSKRGRKRQHSAQELHNPYLQATFELEVNLGTNTEYNGINALRIWLRQSPQYAHTRQINQLRSDELSIMLCRFVEEICESHNQSYSPDYIYSLCLEIQKYLIDNERLDNIFMDPAYEFFTLSIHNKLMHFDPRLTCIYEEKLWDCGQLGAHSPTVLLNTVMYLTTRHFLLASNEDHLQMSFTQLKKQWNHDGTQWWEFMPAQRRARGQRKRQVMNENRDMPMRCPVKLIDFYFSRCPTSITGRRDCFYLYPIENCVPTSETWFTGVPLAKEAVSRMLTRILVVQEVYSNLLMTS